MFSTGIAVYCIGTEGYSIMEKRKRKEGNQIKNAGVGMALIFSF